MKPDDYAAKAHLYIETLCRVKPNRRTGSSGNRDATDFFANTIRSHGVEIDATPFTCLDYTCGESILTHGDKAFEVHASPYSLGCDVLAELVAVSLAPELEHMDCQGKILLMHGDICVEQLMPKNFVFYNPEHHQKLIALLEQKKPAAIITATGKNPELVGALYPFPLFVDGDFDIPSVYCKDTVGELLRKAVGREVRLRIDARRQPSTAANVIARLNPQAEHKIVITAHIDAYEDTPGALDNASGTVVLLLLAEMLAGYSGRTAVEIVAFNGEDHYSAGGQMDYLRRYGEEFHSILLAVNIDDLGYRHGRSSFSFYGCPPQLEQKAGEVFQNFKGLVPGKPWSQGDHMIFVQHEVPAIAFTSENMADLMRTVTHTAADIPEIIDCAKLVEVAESLNALIRSL